MIQNITKEELQALLQRAGVQPVPVDLRPLCDEVRTQYLTEARKRAAEILSSPNLPLDAVRGNRWYLAADGDDENDGTSESSPWKTTARLHEAQENGTVKPGDGVFFRRGDVWDALYPTRWSGDYALRLKPGVTYSAYGEGAKPMFRNCLVARGAQAWRETEYENVWEYTGDVGGRYHDVGLVLCDDGRAYGIKILPHDPNHPYRDDFPSVDSGMVTNGLSSFHAGGTSFTSPGSLAHDLEFLHDGSAEKLYLYWSHGNPGDSFGEMLLLRRGHVIRCDEKTTDVTVDNLAVKYGGSHGIFICGATNVTIQNCEFGWIGGSYQGTDDEDTTRYGNVVENWGECDGYFIRRCVSYQSYDAGMTSQVAGWDPNHPNIMRNIDFSDNVLALSNSPIELWNPNPPEHKTPPYINQMSDVRVANNYLLYSGYHFGNQRPLKNASFCYAGGRSRGQVFLRCVMENNKMLFTSSLGTYSAALQMKGMECGFEMRNNVYMMGKGKAIIKSYTDPVNAEGDYRLFPYDRETLEALAALGFERDSVFYIYDGYLYPEEADGVYLLQ